MRADAARADRNAAVRAAARSWRRAGAIDDATLAALEAEVPDDRVRVGPVFRVLLFVFTLLAIGAAFGFVLAVNDDGGKSLGPLALAWGVLLVLVTEFQTGPMRRAQGGTEDATAFAALAFLFGAAAWFIIEMNPQHGPEPRATMVLCLLGAALGATAAWRWGFPLYAGAAMASLLLALGFIPGERLLWIVVPLVVAPLLLRLSDSPRLPPAHRTACTFALVVALAGLYFALHYGSVNGRVIEKMDDFGRLEIPPSILWGWLSLAGTALLPVGFLALGIRQRRRPLLLLGLATAAVSLATFYHYAAPGPLWAFLTVCGLFTIAAALAVRRFLDAAPDKERGGFTAEPLFEDLARQRILEAGAAVAAFTPDARTVREEPKYAGGGGEFGGGGSSSEF
jgi:hypothetical protein